MSDIPRSRVETILQDTVGGEYPIVPPRSRVEALLIELMEAIAEGSGAGTVFRLKGSAQKYSLLPVSGNEVGDVYYVSDPETISGEFYPGSCGYAWIDSHWEPIGQTVDTSAFLTKAGLLGTTGQSTDNTMTQKAVTDALGDKQDTLTFDSTPTENSTNPVTSGGVYEAIRDIPAGGGATPDWEENDSAAADYIKNRTHYATPTYSTLNLPYQTYSVTLERMNDITYTQSFVTRARQANYPSAVQDGSMPQVCSYTSRLESIVSQSDAAIPVDLNENLDYKILLDDSVIYTGKPEAVTEGPYSSASGRIALNGGKMLGDEEHGVIIYTNYSSGSGVPVGDHQVRVYYKNRDWYFCLSEELAATSHSLSIQYLSGESVVKLPTKYIDTDSSPTAGSGKPLTSGGAYIALAGKAPGYNLNDTPLYDNSCFLFYNSSTGLYGWRPIYELADLLIFTEEFEDLSTNKKTVGEAINELYQNKVSTSALTQLLRRLSEMENAVAAQAQTISALQSRVSALEAQIGGDGLTAAYIGDELVLSGENAEVDDGILEINSSRVSVVDGILTFVSGGSSGSVSDGELTLSGNGLSVNNDGILEIEAVGTTVGSDGILNI